MSESKDKWRYTFYTTIMFMLIANPYTYKITDNILKGYIKMLNRDGSLTLFGFSIHTLAFTLVVRWMMDLNI